MVGRYTHAHQFKRARRELIAARLRAAQRSKITLARCSISRCGFAIRNSVSAGRRCTGYTRPRSSAIGKGNGCKPTSSGAKLHCDAGHRTQGRPVRAARQGVARQLLRRPHARPHHADLEKLTGVAIRRMPARPIADPPARSLDPSFRPLLGTRNIFHGRLGHGGRSRHPLGAAVAC
jgi:hypothetical protein